MISVAATQLALDGFTWTYKWVTKNHRLTINQAFFRALSRIKTHISSKTEALFSSVPMEQHLLCRYLTVEK